MDYSNTAVIIPCYNEALTIGKVVDDFHRELPGAVVYVYDNNSSDDTSQIANQQNPQVDRYILSGHDSGHGGQAIKGGAGDSSSGGKG